MGQKEHAIHRGQNNAIAALRHLAGTALEASEDTRGRCTGNHGQKQTEPGATVLLNHWHAVRIAGSQSWEPPNLPARGSHHEPELTSLQIKEHGTTPAPT